MWTGACQAPLSMELSRQEYWSGLPFPSSGALPDPGIELGSPALQADALLSKPPQFGFSLILKSAIFRIFIRKCSLINICGGERAKWVRGKSWVAVVSGYLPVWAVDAHGLSDMHVIGWLWITWTFYFYNKPLGVPCPWTDRIIKEATQCSWDNRERPPSI